MPTRNPSKYWREWLAAIAMQNYDFSVVVIDSSSDDGVDFTLLPDNFQLLHIAVEDFDHGDTRNIALSALEDDTEIIVFLTQDSLLACPNSIHLLVEAFNNSEVACAFGRQLPHFDATALAAHARLFNYPPESRCVSLGDKSKLGIKVCFLSNSFAAYRLSSLKAVGGFPSRVIMGEDMFVAGKLLKKGKNIAYVADACVYHSHNYNVIEEFRRYFDIGVFHAENNWLVTDFGSANGEGLRFVRSEFSYLLYEDMFSIPSAILRTILKFFAYKLGRAQKYLPLFIKRLCSMNKGYWNKNTEVTRVT